MQNDYKNQPGPLLGSDDSTPGHLSCVESSGGSLTGQCGLQLVAAGATCKLAGVCCFCGRTLIIRDPCVTAVSPSRQTYYVTLVSGGEEVQ